MALTELKSDPEIKALHDKAVASHEAHRDALLQRPDIAAMRDQLRAAHPLPPQEAELLTRLGLAS